MARMIKRTDDNVRPVNEGEFRNSITIKERTDGQRKNLVQTERFGTMLLDFDGLRRCERAESRKSKGKTKIGSPEENRARLAKLGIKVNP